MADVRWNISFLLLATLLVQCYSQNTTLCQLAGTCAECIEVGPNCAWCSENDFEGTRCNLYSELEQTNCTDIQNPEPYSINITKNVALSNAGESPLGEAVQVQPQEIHLKIRKGETARIEMSVRQVEDYPVDLYYIMDLSESMGDELAALESTASDLVALMKRLTRNFQVGFGSFVDKNVIPFASLDENGDVILCRNCEYPYIFRNRLALTNNTDLFGPTLGAAPVSTSKDAPEGGLQALLQVAVCPDQIGWRDNSRHLVVFASDFYYHVAGDGRLAGIVKPNDGECHLDSTGLYTVDTLMDYPSLGQLSAAMQNQEIIALFVVADDPYQQYRSLIEHIPGSRIATLSANSGAILYTIENFYNEITAEVNLALRVPEELQVAVTSNCVGGVTTPNSLSCSNLQIGDTVSFSIDVTAESCVPGGSTSFTVKPVGFNEELRVLVDVVCDCGCEGSGIPNSPACNHNGTLACGLCTCNPGMYGEMCECTGDSSSTQIDLQKCVAPNANLLCSGRGQCICGECVCNKQQDPTHIVSGKYCQCDNFNCPLYEGELCGGPSRGNCICDMEIQSSRCNCTYEYTGDSCSCLRSTENCVAQNGLLCNAHGDCQCGACRCNVDSPFKGPTCSDCATCVGKCEVYQECVQCREPFNSGPLTAEQCSMCNLRINFVKEFPNVDYPYNCSVTHTDNCSIVFIPHFVDGPGANPIIYVLEETVCPLLVAGPGVDARWIGVGLAIFIVILGIILILLYKWYITWLYRKEFEEWKRARDNAQWEKNENPIYKAPSHKVQNPAYGQDLFDSGEKQELNGDK